MMRLFLIFFAILTVSPHLKAIVNTPYIRMKAGYYLIDVSTGNRPEDDSLGAMLTIQPTLLWDFPALSSRIGVHYLGDFNSDFGLIPISGIGLSGYFYPYGITSGFESGTNGVTIQKFKHGVYVTGGITPVNFSYNDTDPDAPENNVSFSALVIELLLGVGYDYPIRPNSMLSVSLNYRFGAVASNSSEEKVDYSGLGINFAFTTNYF